MKTPFERAVGAVAKSVKALAEDHGTLDQVTRATDRAYRAMRYLDDQDAACNAISAARAGIEQAIESGRAIRQAARYAEIAKLKAEHREAERNSPTAWMRSQPPR